MMVGGLQDIPAVGGPWGFRTKTQMELSSQELEPLFKYHDTQRLPDKGQMLFIWIIQGEKKKKKKGSFSFIYRA